jgi:hypothetical protein
MRLRCRSASWRKRRHIMPISAGAIMRA